MRSNFKSKGLEQGHSWNAQHQRGDAGTRSWRGRATPAGSVGRRTEGCVGDRVTGPAEALRKSNPNPDTLSSADEATWTSVVWAVIGVLSACGLAALVFLR